MSGITGVPMYREDRQTLRRLIAALRGTGTSKFLLPTLRLGDVKSPSGLWCFPTRGPLLLGLCCQPSKCSLQVHSLAPRRRGAVLRKPNLKNTHMKALCGNFARVSFPPQSVLRRMCTILLEVGKKQSTIVPTNSIFCQKIVCSSLGSVLTEGFCFINCKRES